MNLLPFFIVALSLIFSNVALSLPKWALEGIDATLLQIASDSEEEEYEEPPIALASNGSGKILLAAKGGLPASSGGGGGGPPPRRVGQTCNTTRICATGLQCVNGVCVVLNVCGNRILETARGEECDDGNTSNNDGCSSTCKIERCGDGIKQTNEGCDDGNTSNNDGCSSTCQVERCGDGIKQTNEGCDDGNTVNGDGCSSTCTVEPRCGDGTCNGTETCSSCAGDCGACPPVCGDGACNGTDTCSNCPGDCGPCPPVCGDGTCNGTDTCSNCPGDCGACPPVCGDGTCNGTETCSSCAGDCGACCGNGRLDPGEACDGSLGSCSTGSCQTNCTCPPPPSGGGCTSDADCPLGQMCNSSGQCEELCMQGFDFPCWWGNCYDDSTPNDSTGMSKALDDLWANGARWIGVIPTWYQASLTSNDIRRMDRTASDAGVRNVISMARGKGFKIFMKPHLDVDNGDWRGFICPLNRGAWQTSYKNFLRTYSQICNETGMGCELFAIGTELKKISNDAAGCSSDGSGQPWNDFWKEVLLLVKTDAPSTRRTYCANWDEYESVQFWTDSNNNFIGIDEYDPFNVDLNSSTSSCETDTPSIANAYRPIRDRHVSFSNGKRPMVYCENGYYQRDCTNKQPWTPNGAASDVQEQADCYDGILTVLEESASDRIVGHFFWRDDVKGDGASSSDYLTRASGVKSPAWTVWGNHFKAATCAGGSGGGGSSCPNGTCGSGENCANCAADCGCTAPQTCNTSTGQCGSPPSSGPTIFYPVEDSWVQSGSPSATHGSDTQLNVDASSSSPTEISYLRFDLGSLARSNIVSAKFKYYISRTSTGVQDIKKVADDTWQEETVTYATAPARGAVINPMNNNNGGSGWAEADVTQAVKDEPDPLFSIGIDTLSSDGFGFHSKENSSNNKPQLVVEAPQCQSDADCASGQVCRSGGCYQSCTQNSNCPSGQVCRIGGTYDRTCGPCTQDSECSGGNTCQNGSCAPPPICGDNIVQGSEQCDGTAGNCAAGCRSDCTCPRCGDNRVDPGEQCDDGNTVDTDNCTNQCKTAVCGDGVVHQGVEECDDANTQPNDACDNTCHKNACSASDPCVSGYDCVGGFCESVGVYFTTWGDWGGSGGCTSEQINVANAMQNYCGPVGTTGEQACEYHLTLGDNFYSCGVSSVTDNLWNISFHQCYDTRYGRKFMSSLGNHDVCGNEQAEVDRSTWPGDATHPPETLWQMGQDSGQPGDWTFTKGGTSSNPVVQYFIFNSDGSNFKDSTSRTWLNNALANSNATWKVLVMHHPILSNGSHGDDEQGNNSYLLPIICNRSDGHNIDLVFSGHDHTWEYLRQQLSGTGQDANGQSKAYNCMIEQFVVGSGGIGCYSITPDTRTISYLDTNSANGQCYGFGHVKVTRDQVRFRFIRKGGSQYFETFCGKTGASPTGSGPYVDCNPPAGP